MCCGGTPLLRSWHRRAIHERGKRVSSLEIRWLWGRAANERPTVDCEPGAFFVLPDSCNEFCLIVCYERRTKEAESSRLDELLLWYLSPVVSLPRSCKKASPVACRIVGRKSFLREMPRCCTAISFPSSLAMAS